MESPSFVNRSWETLNQKIDVLRLRQHEDKILFVLTLIIGASVGLVVVAFILLTENLGARLYPSGGAAWRRVLVPVVGSLISGYLLLKYFPNARGSGIPQTKAALFLNSGIIRLRTVLGKFGCSSLSLASGIALGREGPSVQVGSGIASVLGRQLGLSPANTRALVPIGASAALAAAFNTPIAAVLFTLEEVLGDLHARVLGAIVMSSATSWMVLHLVLGDEPLFHVPAYQLVHPVEFLLYAALGAAGGVVSVVFVKLLLGLRKHFLKMPAWTGWFQPALGGLLVGVLGWLVPSVLGVGYSHVNDALNSRLALGTMALLVALKLVATATCYASGNAGGIFGPSLFIGAMMGGAFGAGAHHILPDYTGSVGAYALVGMGAAFAGIIRVPMTSVIMIFEITRDYSIIVPLMIANLLSYFISSRLQKKPIYEALMKQDGIELPATPRDRESVTFVSKIVRVPDRIFQSSDRIQDALASLDPQASMCPVMDKSGLAGMVTRAQLEEAVRLGRQQSAVADILPPPGTDAISGQEKIPRLYPDQSLDTALFWMNQSGFSVLPVVEQRNPRKLIGVVTLADTIAEHDFEQGITDVQETQRLSKTPMAVLGGIALVLVVMIGLAGFLSYYYRSQRSDRAEQYISSGNALMQSGRYQEAVERYRSALSISHSSKDRLALAQALLKANRWNEAEIYFKELAHEAPESGPVNLGLGRIAVLRGEIQDAINFYHRAIYGRWPAASGTDRSLIRSELIEFLGKSGRLKQAQVELLALVAESPEDAAVQKRIAHLLLTYELPAEAAQLFQEVIKKSPQDAGAFAGLADSELHMGNWAEAQRAFKSALRLNPGDVRSGRQLEVTERILALDPDLRGLKASQKYERSRKLMEALLQSLDRCLRQTAMPLTVSESDTVGAARKSLASKKKPRSYSDATEANLNLSENLWKMSKDICGKPNAADDILSPLMARLFK